jgi:hypothetical protein
MTPIPTVRFPSGETVAALGQGTWNMRVRRVQRDEEIAALKLERAFPRPARKRPLAMT